MLHRVAGSERYSSHTAPPFAQMQTQYLRQLKEIILLQSASCGRLLLCSSGCSSRVSLGKHTGNIAPICCVLQKRIGSLGVDSHCMISDATQHTTSTVYAYQKTVLDGLKVKHSAITKVHYFSDGCTGQY